MFHEDAPRANAAAIVPGEDLSGFSIEDLEDRKAALEAELERTDTFIDRKREGLAAADAVFKI